MIFGVIRTCFVWFGRWDISLILLRWVLILRKRTGLIPESSYICWNRHILVIRLLNFLFCFKQLCFQSNWDKTKSSKRSRISTFANSFTLWEDNSVRKVLKSALVSIRRSNLNKRASLGILLMVSSTLCLFAMYAFLHPIWLWFLCLWQLLQTGTLHNSQKML